MSTPFDDVVVIDFETRWDSKEYTLSKMTTEQYIRDPRFKAFGLCFTKLDSGVSPQWVSCDDIANWVSSVDWSRTAVLAHNAQFDIAILSWVYGAEPCFIFDSLSMARALRGVEVGNSLMKLAEDYKLPPKGKAVPPKGKPVPPKGKGGVSDAQASARDKFKEMIAKKKEAAAKKK